MKAKDQNVYKCRPLCIPISYLANKANFRCSKKLYTWWLPGLYHDRVRVMVIVFIKHYMQKDTL